MAEKRDPSRPIFSPFTMVISSFCFVDCIRIVSQHPSKFNNLKKIFVVDSIWLGNIPHVWFHQQEETSNYGQSICPTHPKKKKKKLIHTTILINKTQVISPLISPYHPKKIPNADDAHDIRIASQELAAIFTTNDSRTALQLLMDKNNHTTTDILLDRYEICCFCPAKWTVPQRLQQNICHILQHIKAQSRSNFTDQIIQQISHQGDSTSFPKRFPMVFVGFPPCNAQRSTCACKAESSALVSRSSSKRRLLLSRRPSWGW